MILFPAIDLKEGLCVRLEQGDMTRAKIFNHDPAAQAYVFESQGFEYLHVVDLDGAVAGSPKNAAAVDRILDAVGIPVQLGGGIRDMATLEAWLAKGVTRTIIGTAAAYWASLALSSMLYGVKPHDPVIFLAVAASILVVVVIASYIPARRATRVDPLVALREE